MDKIQAVEKSFIILEVIARSPNEPHTISALAAVTGMKVPTVSRIVRTMSDLGYLEFAGRKTGYVLGRKTALLSRHYCDRNSLRKASAKYLRDFSEQFGEYICVSHLLDNKRHIVCKESPTRSIQVSDKLTPDVENPYQSVGGRVLMSGLSREQQEKCFERNGAPGKLWPEVIDKEEFLKALAEISKLEYLANTRNETVMLAFPIREYDTIIAALSCFVPEYRFQGEYAENIIKELRRIAAGIAKSIIL